MLNQKNSSIFAPGQYEYYTMTSPGPQIEKKTIMINQSHQ
jgi:hypothetical protein